MKVSLNNQAPKNEQVTVLMVNWNGEKYLNDCLESLDKLDIKPAEIIVIDNGSSDASLAFLRSFSGIKLIENNQNLGFAMANNIGFQEVKTPYAALLNVDMTVSPQWLNQPLELVTKDPRIGAVACRQMRKSEPDTIDGLYHYLGRNLSFVQMGSEQTYVQSKQFSEPGYVLGASGGSMILNMKMVRDCNGFDERFFAYHEDADLCFRAFLKGWKCAYAPESVVEHWASGSFGFKSPTFIYYESRNRFWFLMKNLPFTMVLRYFFPFCFYELRRMRAAVMVHKAGGAYAKALWEGLMGFWMFSQERTAVRSSFLKKRQTLYRFMKKKKMPFDQAKELN